MTSQMLALSSLLVESVITLAKSDVLRTKLNGNFTKMYKLSYSFTVYIKYKYGTRLFLQHTLSKFIPSLKLRGF